MDIGKFKEEIRTNALEIKNEKDISLSYNTYRKGTPGEYNVIVLSYKNNPILSLTSKIKDEIILLEEVLRYLLSQKHAHSVGTAQAYRETLTRLHSSKLAKLDKKLLHDLECAAIDANKTCCLNEDFEAAGISHLTSLYCTDSLALDSQKESIREIYEKLLYLSNICASENINYNDCETMSNDIMGAIYGK